MTHIEISMIRFMIEQLHERSTFGSETDKHYVQHQINVCNIILNDEEIKIQNERKN